MKATSHVFHLIMTFLTGGFWILIWVLCASMNSRHNQKELYKLQKEQVELLKQRKHWN